jgi:tetratricopeptide (TPR) repeat protein
VVQLSDIEGYSDEGRPTWRPIRMELGVHAFGINAWESTEPGQQLIGEHDEVGAGAGGHEEVYVVTSGLARFTVDGHDYPAPAGTVVFVGNPESTRSATAEELGTVILVVGAKRGEAFSISPWERSAEALRYWKTQEWERAIEVLAAQLDERPDSAGTLYNLACAEARAGLGEAAIAHLQRAVELDSRFRDHAQTDADLESLRGDARFPRTAA